MKFIHHFLLVACLSSAVLAQSEVPPLSIASGDDQQVVLTWPGPATDFLLESVENLDEASLWQPASEIPIQTDGQVQVTISSVAITRFFRLRYEPPPGNRPPVLGSIGHRSVTLGNTLVLSLSATDPDGDSLRFLATPLPLPANTSLDTASGLFSFRPNATQLGVHNLTFGVNDGEAADAETVTITVLPPPQGTATAITGIVLDTTDAVGGLARPVAGVKVSLLGVASVVLSGADGRFELTNIPGGHQVLDLDTGAAVPAPDGSPYAGFREEINLFENTVNVIDRPFYLPRIATNSLTTVDPTRTTVVRNPTLGVTLTIPPNTARLDGTNFTGQISISLVPEALAPAALPENLGFGFLITIQPVGLIFAVPVKLTLPNVDNLPPGTELDLWSLDAGTGMFVVVGQSRVTSDGRSVETISGGVRASDWHAAIVPAPAIGNGIEATSLVRQPNECPTPANGATTDPKSGAVSAVHGMTPYRTFSEPRTMELVYDSQTADPNPIVSSATRIPIFTGRVPPPPSQFISMQLRTGGTRGPAVHTVSSTLSPGQVLHQSVPLDARDLPTGIHPVEVNLVSRFPRSLVGSSFQSESIVINHRSSSAGVGWSLAGISRLHAQADGSQLLVDGGSALRYLPALIPDGRFCGAQSFVTDGPVSGITGLGFLAVADFNRDGWEDCLATLGGLFLNDQRGGFQPAVQTGATFGGTFDFATADFDGDGNLDLVLSIAAFPPGGVPARLGTVRGDGTGGFAALRVVAQGLVFPQVEALDVNHDGRPDILALDGNRNLVATYLGRGDGTFLAPLETAATSSALTFAVTDLNGDTHPDVLVLNRNTGGTHQNGALSLFLGDGAGNSILTGTLPLEGDPAALVTGDFNGDDRQDVVVAWNGVDRFSNPAAVDVLLGNGQGGLRPSGTFVMATLVGELLGTGDLDADGALDLVYSADGGDRIGVMLGNGGGGFGVPRFSFVGSGLVDLVLADFDRDGTPDLVANPRDNNALSLARGDGRGGFDTAPITSLVFSGFPGSLIPGDFDNDGSIELFAFVGPPGGRVARNDNGILQFPFPAIPGDFRTAGSDAAADFDRDGNLDVAVVHGLFGTELRVLLLDGQGGEKRHQSITLAEGTKWVSAADLNEDGWPDLLCTRRDQLLVFLARGNAEFDPPFSLAIGSFPPDPGPFGIGDLNGDGHLDLAVPNASGADMSLYLFQGDGRGSFAARPKLPLSRGGAVGTRIADLNGDGLADVVTLANAGRGGLQVHLAKPDGTLEAIPEVVLPATLGAVEFFVGEYTGDAWLDIVCFSSGLNGGYRSAFILPGDGTGRFSFGSGVVLPTTNGTLVPLDLDADGVWDLVAGDGAGQSLLTFLGKGQADGKSFRSPPGDFAMLVRNADGTFTRRLKSGTRIEFNAAGFQTAIVDRNGNSTTYTYSGERLVEVTDPVGLKTLFSYASDLLASITNPDGRVTRFVHDAGRNLVAITDPDASVRRFGYDSRNRMISQTDKVGALTRYAYNSAGQFVQADLPDGSTRKLNPTAAAGLADPATDQGTAANPLPTLLRDDVAGSSTDGNGNVTAFNTSDIGEFTDVSAPLGVRSIITRDRNDLPTRIVRANGRLDVMAYDECGNLTSLTEAVGTALERRSTWTYLKDSNRLLTRTDAEGYVWRYEYDAKGNLTKITDPLGGTRRWEYDARGLVTARIDANGNTQRIEYDARGNIAAVVNAGGVKREVTRDAAGRPTQLVFGVDTPEFRRWDLEFNERNQLLAVTDGAGARTTRTYDTAGRQIAVKRPLVPAVETFYNSVGGMIRRNHPIRGSTTFERDANGNVKRTINALGHASTAAFDALNRHIETTDPLGSKVRRAYDEMGNVISITDAKGEVTLLEFDLLGRLVSRTDPVGRKISYRHDRLDRRIEISKADGVRIQQEFDCLGRITKITAPDDVSVFTYDANGNLLTAEDNDSALAYTYDVCNRVLTCRSRILATTFDVTVTYAYNAVGERSQMADSLGGLTQYQRDAVGRLSRLASTGFEVQMDYDPAGRQTEVRHPNGIISRWNYAASGHLSQLEHRSGATPIERFDYTYNPLGRPVSIVGLTETRTQTYDERGLLIAGGTADAPENYLWDVNGSPVSWPFSSNQIYDDSGRITASDTKTFTNDSSGNRTRETVNATGDAQEMGYNSRNQLTQVRLADGTTKVVRYNALGQSVEDTVNGVPTRRVVRDGSRPAAETDGGNAVQARNYFEERGGLPLTVERSGNNYTALPNERGDIIDVADPTGIIANRYRYTAAGQTAEKSETVEFKFGLGGQEVEPFTGWIQPGANTFDPATGQGPSDGDATDAPFPPVDGPTEADQVTVVLGTSDCLVGSPGCDINCSAGSGSCPEAILPATGCSGGDCATPSPFTCSLDIEPPAPLRNCAEIETQIASIRQRINDNSTWWITPHSALAVKIDQWRKEIGSLAKQLEECEEESRALGKFLRPPPRDPSDESILDKIEVGPPPTPPSEPSTESILDEIDEVLVIN